MSTIGIIYIIGSAIALVMAAYGLSRGTKGDITILDIFLLIAACILIGLLSWIGLFIWIIVEYGDRVVIKRRRD